MYVYRRYRKNKTGVPPFGPLCSVYSAQYSQATDLPRSFSQLSPWYASVQ